MSNPLKTILEEDLQGNRWENLTAPGEIRQMRTGAKAANTKVCNYIEYFTNDGAPIEELQRLRTRLVRNLTKSNTGTSVSWKSLCLPPNKLMLKTNG